MNVLLQLALRLLPRLLLTGLLCLGLVGLITPAKCLGQERIVPVPPQPYLYFDREPEYQVNRLVKVFDERMAALWTQALRQGDRDVLCQTGEAVLLAKGIGQPGLDEKFAGELLAAYEKSTDAVARRSLALAIVELNFADASAAFAKSRTENDYALCRVIEPALGTWKEPGTIEDNLQRIADPSTLVLWQLLAIDVLGNAQEPRAKERLLYFVLGERQRVELRFAAARALGSIFSDGLLESAEALAQRDRQTDAMAQLLAVELIARHTGPPVIALLQKLARVSETTVQSKALTHLQRLAPELVADFAIADDPALGMGVMHPDNNVRRLLIVSCYQMAQPAVVPVLVSFLNDPHPDNRTLAGDALYALTQSHPELKEPIIASCVEALNRPDWRVLEQAAFVLANLKVAATHPRMLALLNFERAEVAAAAGFAIKEFNLPETLAPALAQVQQNQQRQFDLDEDSERHDFPLICFQTQHLCELLGRNQYEAAVPALKEFIPKAAPDGLVHHDAVSRGVAIWALGKIHLGNNNPELADLLRDRLNDVLSLIPEFGVVRQACAYALAWMGDEKSLGDLRRFSNRDSTGREAGGACAWAVQYMTGEEIPLSPPFESLQTADWFLSPTNSQQPEVE